MFVSGHAYSVCRSAYYYSKIIIFNVFIYAVKWIDGAFDLVMPPLPLFWTSEDIFAPLGVRGALLPRELHAKLQPSGAPLLGFDLLTQQAAAANEAAGR